MPDDHKPEGGRSDVLRLPDYLPYQLSVASNKASRLIAQAYQARFGLSIWEWRVIAVLGQQGGLTAQAICEATAMDKVTVSRAIRNLDNRGLIEREQRAHDRRASDVHLTSTGQSVYEEVVPFAHHYERQLLADFSDAEAQELSRLLKKLERQAEALGAK